MRAPPIDLAGFELECDILRAFKPPARLSIGEWAETNLVLPAESNAIPGPLKLTSYQRQILDALDDPATEIVVLKLAAQTGKSLVIDAFLGHAITTAPGPALVVQPTDIKARGWVRDRLNPLVASTSTLRSVVGDARQNVAADSLSFKKFVGGTLNIASSHKADDLAARSIRYLLCDEVDRFSASAGHEGDPVELALRRTATFRNRKIVLASTPTTKASRIEAHFLRGDQRRFVVPCHECGTFDELHIGRLRFDKADPVKTAYLTCLYCGARMNDRQRIDAVERGEFRATAADRAEAGVVSFHLNEFASPFSQIGAIALAYHEALGDASKMLVFTNTRMGEIFDGSDEVKLEAGDLQSKAEPIRQPLPADVSFVTAGVDVQGDRLEVTFLASTYSGSFVVLDHRRLIGDTTSPQVWHALDAALGATFQTKDGRLLPVEATAVDAGFSATAVVAFVASQRAKQRRCYPVRGAGGFHREVLKESVLLQRAIRLLIVGVDGVKLAVAKRLRMNREEIGAIHLPDHLDGEYFAGLAAEELSLRYVKGQPQYRWNRTRTANEPLDTLSYAFAISTLVRAKPRTAAASPAPTLAERVKELHEITNGDQQNTERLH